MYDHSLLNNRIAFSSRRLQLVTMTALTLTVVIRTSTMSFGSGDNSGDDKKTVSQSSTSTAKAEILKTADEKNSDEKARQPASDKDSWIELFNGKNLDGWKITNFGGEGEVFVEGEEVIISQGVDLSGIHTERELPKSNYEIQFEAKREQGSDFFAGVTFPVKDSHCSLILGGWGGGVCGISSLDGMDASENETTSYQAFEKGKWYKVRIEVRDNHLNAWLDDKSIVDVDTTGMRIGTRFEVDKSKPFGFATYATTGRLRKARVRPLPPEQKAGEQKPGE